MDFTQWEKYERIECPFCKKDFYSCFLKGHIKRCEEKKLKNEIKFENLILYEDYVICGLCKEKYVEINNFHLKKHKITKNEYDNIYPNSPRISINGLKNKNHFKVLTKEVSERLKFGHSLEGFKQKYGEEKGFDKWMAVKESKRYGKSLERYISVYGEKGVEIRNEHNKSRAITLEKLIKKFGKQEGEDKWKWIHGKNTLERYQLKYGLEDGLKRWLSKCEKQSKAVRKIPIELLDKYTIYCQEVSKFTKLSISNFKFETINRGVGKANEHLDHMVSKCFGFLNGIPAFIIGSIFNLKMISCSENCAKREKNSKSHDELIREVYENEFYTLLINNFYGKVL